MPEKQDVLGPLRTASDKSWRKRVGVEPTKSRLATLSGFEGQPPHRERFPSTIHNSPEPSRCHLRLRHEPVLLALQSAATEVFALGKRENCAR